MRSVRTGLTALALAGVVVFAGPAAPSSAHAELISSTPADGATVGAVPASASLTFTDEIAEQFVRTAVTTPAGTTTVRSTAKGQTVTVPIQPAGPGGYKVVYRVVSADGHPISGQLKFTVAGTPTVTPSTGAATLSGPAVASSAPSSAPSSAAPASDAASSASSAQSGSDSGGSGSWILWGAIGLAVVAGGGAVAAAARGRRS